MVRFCWQGGRVEPSEVRRGDWLSDLPIGRKIIGLSVVILSLMLASAVYAYLQSSRVYGEQDMLLNSIEPLSREVEMLDERSMEEALFVERALRDTGAATGNTMREATDQSKLTAMSTDARDHLDQAARLLSNAKANATNPQTASGLGQLEVRLDEVRRERAAYEASARALFAAVRARDPNLRQQEDAFVTSEDRLDQAIARLATGARSLTTDEDARLGSAEEMVQLASLENLLMAIGAFLLGTLLSSMITRRMLRPVRSLIAGTEEVAKGNYDIALPAASRDEIGRLSGAFETMTRELKSQEALRETFGSYVDPRIVERLLGEDRAALEAGERREMTVMFADLEGFTKMGEALTPTALVKVINRYLTLGSEPIAEQQGVIDKFIGDAIMAFWGPPFTDEDHALRACRAALAEERALATLRQELPELLGLRKAIPSVKMRIGLATGDVVVGVVGARASKSFTVMGDSVNLASRLEGANKFYGTATLICEATAARVRGAIELREIDLLAAAGKEEPVRIFELLGVAGATDPSRLRLRDAFEEALADYRAGEWAAAERGFAEALRIVPDDPPSQTFLDRAVRFQAEPPALDWRGIWHSQIK
jgi:adenylate cyclase